MNFFPQNSFTPNKKPRGIPTKEAKIIAMEETLKENKTILKTSLSKEKMSLKAVCNPSKIKLKITPQLINFSWQIDSVMN